MPKKKQQETVQGRFQGTSRGFGFVIPDEGGEDYFIPPRATGGAWNGDRVRIAPEVGTEEGGRRAAAVVAVLERANPTVTGVLRRYDRELWLQPDSDKLPGPIKVVGKAHAVRSGEKAALEMESYGTQKHPPMGALRETFGRSGSREAATAAVLYQHGVETEFPPAVLDEAAAIPQEAPEEAFRGRLDLREETVITIDGASSKDLDDAVSLTRDGRGRWVLGVHIADVSHYVAEKSPLDGEAWERGTSVYFADRVVPMLPVALSNGICSLNPGVDRLALSCLMTMDPGGEVAEHTVAKSVIRSAERMTYEDCNVLLGGGDGALEARYAHILPMLREMAELAKILAWRRKLRGSLDLDTSESYIVCDGEGRPVDVRSRKQGVSEALIESFMLAANETVAQHLSQRGKPAVYRVHEKPSREKAEGLKTMLEPFGYAILEADHFTLQKVLDDARDKPEAPIISTLVLRSLMKARYDVQNLGHFGLAAQYYCHFTSPIRRYPDLMVHRILTRVIEDEAAPANRNRTMPWEKRMAAAAQKAAVQSSEREIAAQNAEREIEKFYMAEFMAGHLGEEMGAAVSGVTKFGLFVMLPSGVEGMIPVEALPADRYHYDESRMALRGEKRGRVFSFGMALTVVCAAADPGSGQIEFRLAGEGELPVGPRRPRKNDFPPVGKPKPHGAKGGKRARPPRHKAGGRGKR